METTLQDTVSTAWKKSKWIIKGFIIGLLVLLLLIPMEYVKGLVYEREGRQKEVAREIAGKWAGPQNMAGPVIGVPFWKSDGGDTSKGRNLSRHIAYFLPDVLNIDAKVNPREKHRGIYKVMLYDARITLTGSFSKLAIDKLDIPVHQFLWNEAFVSMHIADPKGLNDEVKLSWNDSIIELSPQTGSKNERMTARLRTATADDFNQISFSAAIDLNGSEQLLFTPVGNSTGVTVSSSWKDPSFSGFLLPQTSEVKDTGFTATWKSIAHKRSFPQQWVDELFELDDIPAHTAASMDMITGTHSGHVRTPASSSSFGVSLFIPVNGYQKTLRTIKYAMLCIVLTFAAFFLVETAHKKSIHPFQYGLVGLALVLFYTLLLSFSEYTGFNMAYLLASVATVGLIAWFVKNVLQSGRATTILSAVLVIIYSYIFSLLQLSDYSLLLGSIGLFLALAVVMYFSRKMQW